MHSDDLISYFCCSWKLIKRRIRCNQETSKLNLTSTFPQDLEGKILRNLAKSRIIEYFIP
ncbi:unnamed protein product [Moneuplotes crassus]|uniref:Uncharacterized protein n=1 Tax=Euplotes crassus TaxID=5936 RepID=A0AAD1XE54_EUPCR|nr:unnamed protein product [Moneuplotes crassus]